jgi:virulence-associated protein VagC
MRMLDVRHHGSKAMKKADTAKLFRNGRSQAVRLTKQSGALLAATVDDVDLWFAELDRFAPEPFMPEGRDQPATPTRDRLS